MASSKRSTRRRDRRERRRPSDLLQFIALSIVAGFVTAGLLIPPAAAAGLTANASINWFKGLPDDLQEGPLSQPSTILASDGSEITKFFSENRDEVPLDQISQHMIDAQLSIEDNDFYDHGGVDGMGIARAILNNIVNPGKRQGASTITQQYVNNLLIDSAVQNGGDPTATLGANKGMMDKIKEMKLAISMEQNKSKDQILNGYLNIVNYGGSNYGVQAAAKYYWGIDAKDLNIQQSATLAGMVQSPVLYDPATNPESSKKRRNIVLGTMLRDKKITEDQYDKAIDSGLDLDIHPTDSGCTVAKKDSQYFCSYVQNAIALEESLGTTPEERAAKLNRGGLTIKTTLDPKAQSKAQDAVEGTQPTDSNPDNVNTSLVSVQPGTGNIRSMAQNSHYSNEQGAGNTIYNYNADELMGGTQGYAPGSTFKPFTLTEWIKEGNGVNATVDASPLSYPAGTLWHTPCLDSKTSPNPGTSVWSFQNATPGYNWAGQTVNFGIYNSINSNLFATARYLNLCAIGDVAGDLGAVNGVTGDHMHPEKGIAQLIGTQPVPPLFMANAFATFASEGMYCKPRAIDSITDRNGKAVDVPGTQCTRKLDKDVARGVSYVLKNVLTQGSGYQRGIGLENASAAKTGTTDDSTQTWMVGYTSGLATASWVGNNDLGGRSLNGLSIGGQSKSYVDGATFAGAQWQWYMNQVKNDYEHKTFTDPSAKVTGTQIVSKLP